MFISKSASKTKVVSSTECFREINKKALHCKGFRISTNEIAVYAEGQPLALLFSTNGFSAPCKTGGCMNITILTPSLFVSIGDPKC